MEEEKNPQTASFKKSLTYHQVLVDLTNNQRPIRPKPLSFNDTSLNDKLEMIFEEIDKKCEGLKKRKGGSVLYDKSYTALARLITFFRLLRFIII